MNLKQQDERFTARNAALGCATSIKLLVILFVLAAFVVAAMVLRSGSGAGAIAAAVFCFFAICGLAAVLWALGLLMLWQVRIEENTRAAADALEKLAGGRRDPMLSDLTARDIQPPPEKTDD